jgi:hypothetical protein
MTDRSPRDECDNRKHWMTKPDGAAEEVEDVAQHACQGVNITCFEALL